MDLKLLSSPLCGRGDMIAYMMNPIPGCRNMGFHHHHRPSGTWREYRRTGVNQQGYTKPVQTISALSSRYNTQLGHGYENDHTHVRRQAHHIPYPQYESHALGLYEIVEVFDPYGSYFIKRPVRPPSQREIHYEDRPQLYAVSNEFQRQHNHGIRSGERTMRSNPRSSDYEEYDPRFPAASWRG